MSNEEDYVLIPTAELPECKVVERDGEYHVDCGSDLGTWNVKHIAKMRETALEYVAAWQTAEDWHSEQAEAEVGKDKRRNDLARELSNCGYDYLGAAPILRDAIDRIIYLESAA